MFVTVPFLGSYNCATTGFCHWGALTAPFARVGFFRLKVKDKKICQACTTFDCAKACPVGLVDMPLYFRRDGEYRSSKCCGVGDCVGACPYGNMYHQDVRFWLRRALARKRPAPPIDRGIPLPMVSNSAPHASKTSSVGPATEVAPDPTSA
jgi:polyferredoxin